MCGHEGLGQSSTKAEAGHNDRKIVIGCVLIDGCKERGEPRIIRIDLREVVAPVLQVIAAAKRQHEDIMPAENAGIHGCSRIRVDEQTLPIRLTQTPTTYSKSRRKIGKGSRSAHW